MDFLKSHDYSDCHCAVFTLEVNLCARIMLHVVQTSLAGAAIKITNDGLKPA